MSDPPNAVHHDKDTKLAPSPILDRLLSQFGTSLPSSVVTVNVTRTLRGESVKGRPSAPHGLMVAETGIDYLEVSWSGPAISDPEDTLKYK